MGTNPGNSAPAISLTHQISQTLVEEQFWGDDIQQAPKSNDHRIYFHNLDGMKNDSDEIDLYISTMAQLHVDTVCWADPGLDFSQKPIRAKVQRTFQNHFNRVKITYSSCHLSQTSDHRGNGYQPGGTLTATTGSWVSRSNGMSLCDPSGMGRWSGVTLVGKDKQQVSMITAYRSPRQVATGGFGFYDQQHAILLSRGTKRPNVRRQFITDLTVFINELQDKGHHIVLSLDANETISQEKHFGISSVMEQCQLSDLHSLGVLQAPPATYKYGSHRRIDFIFGSARVKNAVRQAGFNAYDNGIDSKHRGIFIDLKMNQILGRVSKIAPASARRLSSEDMEHVDIYLSHLKKYIEAHGIRLRLTTLQSQASALCPQQTKEKFDAIDRDLTRGMLHAERKTKKAKGKYQWSPKLRAQGLITRYWRIRYRMSFYSTNSTLQNQLHIIKSRLTSFSIPFDDDLTQSSIKLKARWKDAIRALKKIRIIAYDYRQVHLNATLLLYEEQAHHRALLCDSDRLVLETKIKRIRHLIQLEILRGPFKTLRKTVAMTSSGSGITKLLVPSSSRNDKVKARFCLSDGSVTSTQLFKMAQFDKTSVNYDTIIDPQEMEREILSYNFEWFRQAADTPFGQGELYDYVGFDGLTPGGDFICDGAYPTYAGLQLSSEIETLMTELKRPQNVESLDVTITCDQFRQAIKTWKETTSTSPSGRHLGHYKSAILDNDMSHLHTDMLNLPITYGFAPARWCVSVCPLMEKDPGLPYIQRLRVIHLFEADYNLFLKIVFGKRMVAQAEKKGLLNDQQHGSRPRRTTTDALFLSRLSKDILRQTRTNSIHMDNDATGCYDRILISIGMLACRRLGVPLSAIKCQADTLRHMQYSIKHAFGTSKHSYSGTETSPLFGTGQGSAASPAIWLAVAVTLLNSFDSISTRDDIPGLSFSDPWKEIVEKWRISAFVDDTNQGISDTTHTLSATQLVNLMTMSAQTWEVLLTASGGALNLSKCMWSIQMWQWKHGRPHLQESQADSNLLLTSGASHEQHIINQIPNSKATKSLGVWMNFTGTFEAQATAMQQKFDRMASNLQSTDITPSLAQIFYHSYFLPSARYPLPVTTLTPKQLQRIQSKFVGVTITKMGFNRHYPRAVVFAPKAQMGCGLHDLTLEQGLAHIQSILDYVGTGHKVGQVMTVSLRTLQVEAGVPYDVLATPRTCLPYLTHCWITGLRSFCAANEISINIRDNKVPSPSRLNDTSIMETALSLPFRKQELIDINLTRMHLQVTFMSDIASACGTLLHPHIWRGYRIPDRSAVQEFPRQPNPTPLQRALWRKMLRHLLYPDATSTNLRLLHPLGVWIAPPSQKWGAMLWNDTLYRCNPFSSATESRSISVHFPHLLTASSTLQYYDSKPDWYSATIPRLASPADLTGSLIYFATFAEVEYASIPKPAKKFAHWCAQLEPSAVRLLRNIFFNHCSAEKYLIQLLQTPCTLFIGTDGGKKRTRGSFAWIICGPDRTRLISNFGPVDGWQRCLSSLRSEATAIASVTVYLAELVSFYDIPIQCNLQFYVDSTSAISNVQQLQEYIPKRKYSNNYDIISVLQQERVTLHHYQLSHVRSHQDLPFEQLSFPAQLNTMCDRLATRQMQMQSAGIVDELSMEKPEISTSTPITIRHGDRPVTSNVVSILRHQISSYRHQQYLMAKFDWTVEIFDSIAWESIEQSSKKTSDHNRATRSKLAHNWLHLGDQRAKYTKNAAHSAECPLCHASETFHHLLSCPAPRAQQHRYHALNQFRTSLRTLPQLGTLLATIITVWTCNKASTPEDIIKALQSTPGPAPQAIPNGTLLADIVTGQANIGWEGFFRGYLSKRWMSLCRPLTDHDSFLDQSILLLSKCVRALQDYALSLWTFRSSVLHEHDAATALILHAQLHSNITSLYHVKDQFSDIIQSYFRKPLEERLLDSIRLKQRWLALARLATSHSTATSTRQQAITTYYQTSDTMVTAPIVSPLPSASLLGYPGLSDLTTVRRPLHPIPLKTLIQTSIRAFCTAHPVSPHTTP